MRLHLISGLLTLAITTGAYAKGSSHRGTEIVGHIQESRALAAARFSPAATQHINAHLSGADGGKRDAAEPHSMDVKGANGNHTLWSRSDGAIVANRYGGTGELWVNKNKMELRTHDNIGRDANRTGSRNLTFTEKRYFGGLLRVAKTVDITARADNPGGSDTPTTVNKNERRIHVGKWSFKLGRGDGFLPKSGNIK